MPHLPQWSERSAICRLEIGRSRWQQVALSGLTVAAVGAALTCELPDALAWCLALVAGSHGLWLQRGLGRRPVFTLSIPAGPGQPSVAGVPVTGLHVRWRGPMAFLDWRGPDGRLRRQVLWPDVLPAAARRELKLAMLQRQAVEPRQTVAG